MTKIALNREIGGFSLSHKACILLAEKKGWNLWWTLNDWDHREYHGKTDDEILAESPGYHFDYYIDYVRMYWKGDWSFPYIDDRYRSDPELIAVIEELGDASAYRDGSIKIVEIPDDVDWFIDENDMGYEWVAEKHRIWTEDGMKIQGNQD